MSNRPRHGNLAFLPRKRTSRVGWRGRIKAFPKDDKSKKPHLTAFLGYKAGTTHIVREANKPGSKIHKKDVVEEVTLLETPPMVVVGIVGYYETPFGMKVVATVMAQHLSENFIRRFYKNYMISSKFQFKKHTKFYNHLLNKQIRKEKLAKIVKFSKSVRAIVHTQIGLIKTAAKKAHIAEIQVNGGTTFDKVKFVYSLFEQYVPVSDVFAKNDTVDTIGITQGKGFKGVTSRWGTTKLPRKTHKGLRKVACIGAWHPARVSWTVARAGQKGLFQRTHYNQKIYMMGKSLKTQEGQLAGKTEYDLTEKSVNPMGGFPKYGMITEDYVMIKGSILGAVKRCIVLRRPVFQDQGRDAKEEIVLKFIDTSSKKGTGHFQTHDEKKKFFGVMKRDRLQKEKEAKVPTK